MKEKINKILLFVTFKRFSMFNVGDIFYIFFYTTLHFVKSHRYVKNGFKLRIFFCSIFPLQG